MECTVCSNKFNKTNFAPRMLKCGHSICHSCLCLMHKNLKFNYTCGICGESYPCALADCPPNFAIEDMIAPEIEPTTEKCRSHERELTKFCKRCKVPTCDLCSANEHSAKFGCQECSLDEQLKRGLDVDAIRHLTHLVNANKMKKQKIEESIKVGTLCEVAFDQTINVGSCIRKDRSFLEHQLKEVESLLTKLDSLINKKEFTTFAEYSNYEKQLQLFNKFDANVDNVCNIGFHTSCNILLEHWMSIGRVIRDILTRNKDAYFSFDGDSYRRIIEKDGAFRVNLDLTEPVLSSSELPANSLQFKCESWPYYTILIKAAHEGGEFRLNVELRDIGSEIFQDVIKTLMKGRNCVNSFTMYENAFILRSYLPLCVLTCSNSKIPADPKTDWFSKRLINGLGNSASDLRVETRKNDKSAEAIEEKFTEIDGSKLAILAYLDPKYGNCECYFMKCGIGFIGEGVTLIGYLHGIENVLSEVNFRQWSAELGIL